MELLKGVWLVCLFHHCIAVHSHQFKTVLWKWGWETRKRNQEMGSSLLPLSKKKEKEKHSPDKGGYVSPYCQKRKQKRANPNSLAEHSSPIKIGWSTHSTALLPQAQSSRLLSASAQRPPSLVMHAWACSPCYSVCLQAWSSDLLLRCLLKFHPSMSRSNVAFSITDVKAEKNFRNRSILSLHMPSNFWLHVGQYKICRDSGWCYLPPEMICLFFC